ncbi:hypothetical protein KKD03_03050 [Patescibacteria group bacterium]|nr:hypothetical protein [Patescibacteria group bacterium]
MFNSIYLTTLIAGFAGGVVRVLVGFIKHQFAYKKVGFNLPYFLAMMFLSGVVGLLSAVAIKDLGLAFLGLDAASAGFAFVVGYVYLPCIMRSICAGPSVILLRMFIR